MPLQVVEIILDKDEAQCLLEHADRSSIAWAALKASITRWIVTDIPVPAVTVDCPANAARDLLHIAEGHCHSAVEKIKKALKHAGLADH